MVIPADAKLENELKIDCTDFDDGLLVRAVLASDSTVQEFLNEIWVYLLSTFVPSYTYGKRWVLIDPVSGSRIDKIDKHDGRKLSEAGIKAGILLKAIRLDK